MENIDITLERTSLANWRAPMRPEGPNSNLANINTASDSGYGSDYQTVASYIREVGAYKLLSRDDEVRIAKRIEAGEHIILHALLQTPRAAEHILYLGRQIETGALSARKILRSVKIGEDVPGESDVEHNFLKAVKRIKRLHDANQVLRDRLAADDRTSGKRRRMYKATIRQAKRMADLLREWRLNYEIIECMVNNIRSQADRMDSLISSVHQLAGLVNASAEEVTAHLVNQRRFMQWTKLRSSLTTSERASLYQELKNAVQSIKQMEVKLGMNAGRFMRIRERVEFGCRVAQTAKNEFVTANLRLVFNIARRYSSGKMQLLDCIQEGNLGLIKAVEKFDYRFGFKFSTYATWWIKQAIFRAIDNHSRLIRIPVHMNENLKKIKRTSKNLTTEECPARHTDEIAAELNISRENVDSMLKFDEEPLSLNAPLSDHGGSELGYFISDGEPGGPLDCAINHDAAEKIRKALATLSPREERVLRLRFGIGEPSDHTLDEISRDFALTRERIRQIEARALQKLRHPTQLRQLACFIEN
jgi:RNA polymerase primary sigma factor